MQESSIAILAETYSRLQQLVSANEFGSPPKRLQLRDTAAIFIGRASTEQRAIAILYDQVCGEHKAMHEADGLPEGINPRVDFDHYYNHVTAPLLSELLIWSAHRDYPEVSETISIIAIQIDDDWNMYAIPKGAA